MKMKKNKTPPDNTGKKYLTELTPKQRKFIDVYCSKYGEITGTACAIAAGYSRDSAHTKASELLDYRKYPQVSVSYNQISSYNSRSLTEPPADSLRETVWQTVHSLLLHCWRLLNVFSNRLFKIISGCIKL